MKKLIAVAALFVSTNCLAAVAPYYDSLNRIGAVLEAQPLSKDVVGRVTSIKEVANLMYEVTAANCTVRVILEMHAPKNPGPAAYTVKSISSPVCESK